MASALAPIYDIMPENYAYSSTGELGTKFLSACVPIIFIFVDHIIMIEYGTDAEFFAKGDLDEALQFLESIMKNIRKFKGKNRIIR